ncbi:MAG: 8-amino-7-oxononanoate synthase [Firmicutes bacterium HGW-Firmicutes-1]|jgi:8-amino-7-oxononanoate synthase|nr:MAG: 8-amino-7-oxononanoate synthase [Firmicutes bacterium HGW-Firmicutes-1]
MHQLLNEKIQSIKEKGLYRKLRYLENAQAPRVVIDSKNVILMGSNNYLGLCDDDRLKETAIKAIQKYGVGSGGSRLTTGSYDLHKELERKIAEFKGTEASIVFNTGYMANVGTINAITDRDWVIFSDRLNHASIVDGSRLSGAELIRYKHCDMDDLVQKIKKYKKDKCLLVTDGVFSMDGDIAPLPDLVEIAEKYSIMTMVDDAHATGILGKNGAGTPEYFGLENQIDVHMGTLSKAIASEGGYVAGKQILIDYLINHARSFIYSTALAPASIAVSINAIEIMKQEPERRIALLKFSDYFQNKLDLSGFEIKKSSTAIIPIMIGGAEKAAMFSQLLFEEGIYVPAIRPPTVPTGTSRLRVSLMATHTKEDLDEVIHKMILIGKKLEIIA